MTDLLQHIASETRSKACAFVTELGKPIELLVASCADYSSLLRGEHETAVNLTSYWNGRRAVVA